MPVNSSQARKVDKFNSLLREANMDTVTYEEVAGLIKTLIVPLTDLKTTLSRENNQANKQIIADVTSIIRSVEKKYDELSKLNRESESKNKKSLEDSVKELKAAIKAVENKIPSLSYLEDGLEEVRGSIPEIPDMDDMEPEEIRDALESLEDDERLDYTAIKGLEERIAKIKPGGGGGGFLNIGHWPRHESFTMNGSDTTVTLEQAPAAQGSAIFGLEYQGQMQVKGTHYTVDGNKITLLFTPEVDTIISISYMP